MGWILICAILIWGAPTIRLHAKGDWQTWNDCELLEEKYMDGDSFYVQRSPRSVYILRLYFVDCPESDNRFPDRVAEQAEYFGIEPDEALECGETATEFTRKALEDGFTVHTRKQKSYSASSKPRYYAFIEYGEGKHLAEELVRNGLARIYGKPSDRPDGKSERAIFGKLGRLKDEAKAQKAGAWRYNPEIERDSKYKLMDPDSHAGKQLTTEKTLAIFTYQKPHKFRGLLRGEAEIELGENLGQQYIAIKFESKGKTIEAACQRRDLDLD